MNRKFSVFFLVIVGFIAGIFFITSGASFLGRGDLAGTASDAAIVSSQTSSELSRTRIPSGNNFSDIFISVAESINPMVVQIHSERMVDIRNPFSGSPFEEFFRRPDDKPQFRRSSALGSGLVSREDGYIITNYHVIADAEDLTVTFLDGRELDAEVVGSDAASDIAVIRVKEVGLPALSIDNTATVRVGEWVLAFGSPLADDLGNTVTSGIVSAVRRTSRRLSTLNLYASFIQTDAAINPGNSGGPLVNLDGQLVGINSAIYSQSGGSQGIGFAIPAEVVRNVAMQLIKSGTVSRGGLGVRFAEVSRSLAEVLGVPLGAAQITEVVRNSVADRSGIKEGDVITAVDGKQLRNSNELRTIVGNRLPGDRLVLSVVRDGTKSEIDVILGDLSVYAETEPDNPDVEEKPDDDMDSDVLGFTIGKLTNQIRAQLGLSGASIEGVVITDIDEGSSAFRNADLQQGDVILSLNGISISSPGDFMDAYRALDPGKTFLIQVTRSSGGRLQKFYTALTRPKM